MAVNTRPRGGVIVPDPPFAVDLFNNTRWSWLWLLLRLYLGYEWLTAGLEKLQDPGWTQTGASLQGFWKFATQVPAPPARPAIAFGWYRDFLLTLLNSGSYVWFSKLVVAGEIIVGVALILGIFTGIFAFIGAFMNFNFMMAGSASINPLMFLFTILVILAWKTAGWYGLDRWLLPAVGTPWYPRNRFYQARREGPVPITGEGPVDEARSVEPPTDINRETGEDRDRTDQP